MKEIWKASANPDNWHEHIVPPLLPWWWFFWLGTNFTAHIAFRLALRSVEEEEVLSYLITSNFFSIISSVLNIVLCFIGIAIVGRVHEMQMSHISRA